MKRRPILERSFPLDDIAIRAGGSGRTVVAYAAVFAPEEYEVHDFEGHYVERIASVAFNRATAGPVIRAVCLFNHGMMTGTTQPSDRFGMPLGTPLEVRADSRGLLTVTEYAQTDLADEVLELIRGGAIRSQSFRGEIFQSREVGRRADGLRVVQRMELGLRDYGPTAFAVAQAAEIVGIRSALLEQIDEQIDDLTDEERARLLAKLSGTSTEPAGDPPAPPPSPSDPRDTSTEPAGDPPAPPPSPSLAIIEAAQAQRRRLAADQ